MGNGTRVKEWSELRKEFHLGRAMKPLVVERVERVKRAGGIGISEEGNWWRKVRWKDGAPSLAPRVKFLYRESVEGERCQQKINRGWNFERQQVEWKRVCKKLWKSKLESKIKVFFWKVIHKGLPVGDRVGYFSEDTRCRRCGHWESIEHICWSGCIAGVFWGGDMTGERAMNSFAKIKEREIIPILAWCCWKVRNLIVFDRLRWLREGSSVFGGSICTGCDQVPSE